MAVAESERVLCPLTAKVRDEFWGLLSLHPFTRTHVASVVNPKRHSTDATTFLGAVTYVDATPEEAFF
eukprot:266353-Amphidinium_carterae.1